MKDTSGAIHLSHRAAPGATEYNGHAIHVKGQKHKLEKLVKKATKTPKTAKAPKAAAYDHSHDHTHEGHTH